MFAPPKLTVSGVFAKLKEIAGMSGNAVSLSHSLSLSPTHTLFLPLIKHVLNYDIIHSSQCQRKWILLRVCLLPVNNVKLATSSGYNSC